MIESPQSFVIRQECDKVAFQNGFRRPHEELNGWRHYTSTTAQGSLWLARENKGGWVVAIDHPGIVAEIGLEPIEGGGPGLARYRFADLAMLYAAMPRVYELAVSLPDAPLHEFLYQTKGLPKTTEAERLVVQRVGQNIFRERLMAYWQGRCPLTGITDKALLRASHIKPWKDCDNDAERLDVHNGLLLSALWDAAFDTGLVTFNDDGSPEFSVRLTLEARSTLRFREHLSLTQKHRMFMEWHRATIFQP
ncbi:HNH endonuclease [Brucella pseudogrignonensis]|uniref:HNH endonuclease family protein n=1 Tax=Brucella pseudogrignonensis TaxID=419475 RepID=A0A256G6M4_9HYPH|nr:HNH endonuclease [Brucella pseudogrignonensis]OYR22616.1 HNH endonuclease family protein [Brucella pseudogrignonensis]